jgi:nucleotide-binding universal stress UspA family protein
MRKAQEENSRRILAPALAMCKERQVDATAAVVEGDAKEAVCHAVEQFQAGLLVLGSRGLGKIKRYSDGINLVADDACQTTFSVAHAHVCS